MNITVKEEKQERLSIVNDKIKQLENQTQSLIIKKVMNNTEYYPRPILKHLRGENVRNKYPHLWNDMRIKALERTNYHCEACGQQTPFFNPETKTGHHLQAHEHFDMTDKVYLTKIVPLCQFCHKIVHLDKLQNDYEIKEITKKQYNRPINHFMKLHDIYNPVIPKKIMDYVMLLQEKQALDQGKWIYEVGIDTMDNKHLKI